MNETVSNVVSSIGFTRLTHFTPSKNLFHIIQDGQITSSADLAERAPEYFSPTDTERFDQRPHMTCVSFTFPNVFYLGHARQRRTFERFPDWVCLLLDVEILNRPGVLFSPCNAARGSGAYLQPGPSGLRACFAERTPNGYRRQPRHHPRAATDIQAEALIPGPIPASHIIGIVVPSQEAAGNEFARLAVGGLRPERFTWVVAPEMFERARLVDGIHHGIDYDERIWIPPQEAK